MSSYLKDTALADFAHFVSRGKLFTPVEKRQGFVIPKKYLKKEGRSKPSPTPASSSPTSEETRIALEEDGEAGKEKGGAGNGDYIIVDWYSKDDPEDPKVSFLNVSIINKSVYWRGFFLLFTELAIRKENLGYLHHLLHDDLHLYGFIHRLSCDSWNRSLLRSGYSCRCFISFSLRIWLRCGTNVPFSNYRDSSNRKNVSIHHFDPNLRRVPATSNPSHKRPNSDDPPFLVWFLWKSCPRVSHLSSSIDDSGVLARDSLWTLPPPPFLLSKGLEVPLSVISGH